MVDESGFLEEKGVVKLRKVRNIVFLSSGVSMILEDLILKVPFWAFSGRKTSLWDLKPPETGKDRAAAVSYPITLIAHLR